MKRRAFLWGSNGNARYTPLEHAKADALALASTLSSERYRFDARVHADTSDPYDVHRALRSAALACAPDDLFVGYFSGHGQVIGGKLYLVIDNSDPDNVSTLFASTWLIEAFRECPARNRLLVLDCCHAGAATGVKGAGLPFEELMPELRNELILYASGKLEDARELPELGGGFLTRSLCRELDAIPAPASLRAIAKRLERAAVQHNTTVGASKRVPIPFLSGLQQGELYFEDFAADVAPERPFVTAPVRERDVAIEDLGSHDPLVALAAAERLAGRVSLEEVLQRVHTSHVVSNEAVRRIAAKADDAARLLVRGITNAGRDWQYSLRCGSSFSSAHATNRDRDAISDLAELLKSADKEVCRCAVYAFGFLGVGGWCWEVRRAAMRAELHSFVVQALMRMFVASTDETTLESCSQQLRDYFSEIDDDFSVLERLIMGGVTGGHVDELIQRWLTSENKKIRRTAIKVLGVARFTRAVQHLVPLLGEPALSGDVARSLAAIGTPEAVAAVLEHGGDDSPLASALDRLPDEDQFARYATKLLSNTAVKWSVVRAIGCRHPGRFRDQLRAALGDEDPLVRGMAALALARLEDPNDLIVLRRAYDESSGRLERMFAAIARVRASPSEYPQVASWLREDLASSYMMEPAVQDDILEVLDGSRHPEAVRLAAAWRPFYFHTRPPARIRF